MLTALPDTNAVGILLGKTGFLQNVMSPSGQVGSGMPQRNQKMQQVCLTYTTNQLVEIVSSFWMSLPIHLASFPMKTCKSFRNSPRFGIKFSLRTLLPMPLSQQTVFVVGRIICSLHPPMCSKTAYTPIGLHRKGNPVGKCSSTLGNLPPSICSSSRSLYSWDSVLSSFMWISS